MNVVCDVSPPQHFGDQTQHLDDLTPAATGQVIDTFLTSRLDFGNALLYRLPLEQIQRLQKVQNWAARLIDSAMKYS